MIFNVFFSNSANSPPKMKDVENSCCLTYNIFVYRTPGGRFYSPHQHTITEFSMILILIIIYLYIYK